jgi:2'-5' RNA ligase
VRVFVAVMLPDAARGALQAQTESLREAAPELTWESPDRWHVTLTFLGEVEASVVEALDSRLQRAASRVEPFRLSFAGVGRFGNRVVHAKVIGDRAALRRLAERTTAAARREEVALRDVRYRPHLTLARSRHDADLRSVVEHGAGISVAEWTVNEFVVVNSVLGRDRRYDVLQRHTLGRDSDAE